MPSACLHSQCSNRNPLAVSKWCSEVRPSCRCEGILFYLAVVCKCYCPFLSPSQSRWATREMKGKELTLGLCWLYFGALRTLDPKDFPPPVSFLSLQVKIMCQHVGLSSLYCSWSDPCLLLVFAVSFSLNCFWTYTLAAFCAKYFIWIMINLYSHAMRYFCCILISILQKRKQRFREVLLLIQVK